MTLVAPALLYVNGASTAPYGFALEAVEGAWDMAERTDVSVVLPQGAGLRLASTASRIAPRTIVFSGSVYGATAAALETAKDAIKALCGSGTVSLKLASRAIVYRGRLESIALTHLRPQLRAGANVATLTMRFVCADPFGWDEAPQLVGFGSTAVAMPLGTAASRGRSHWSGVITIHGAATTPTLTETDAGGNTLGTMAFTWSPTANDCIEIDIGRGLVTRVQSGVRDNGLPYVTAGFSFPRLDPETGDYLTSAWPRLAVSSGVGVARYWRSWR